MLKFRLLFVLLLVCIGVMSLSAQTDDEDESDPLDAPPELIVVSVLPEDGTREVAGRAVITVIFNRPVVPLVIVEEMDNLPQPLTITPAIEGQGEWLNTSIYTFTPDVIWSPSTVYTIMVNAGLTAVDGTVLAKDFVWTFITTQPEVIEVRPNQRENNIALNRNFQMTFNMPMNTESVESAFYIRPVDTNGTTAGEFEWNDENTGFIFRPTELLTIDSNYEAGFDADTVFAASGENPMSEAFRTTFTTVPYPEILGSTPRDGSSPSSVWEVTINFNTFMDVDSFRDLITISPEPEREPDLYFQSWNNSLAISFYMYPTTTYTITLAPGGKDPYGNEVGGYEFSFTTPPYRPQIGMRTAGNVGFYNANNPQTELFVTHMNVSYLDLTLYSVPLAEFALRVLDEDNYDPTYNYRPSDNNLLKNWQIESVAPENYVRFELLNLGEGLYEDKQSLDPGIYFLTMNSPETRFEGYNDYKHFLVVANANLVTKMSI
ncbi:MAG: Ig-like domain-containing protein, partial [Anaerolineae bacterium]|nr:Ig-like domain-containing protein [Anaerolineae bacterium]